MASQIACLLLLVATLSTSPLLTSASTQSGCVATPQWSTPFANTGVFGGNLQSGVSDLVTCQNNCVASSNCIAIDFVQNLNTCWFVPVGNANTKVSRPGITHYDLVRPNCPSTTTSPGCSPWTQLNNSLVLGGSQQPLNDLSSCQTACINFAGCVGIDFNPSNSVNQVCFFTLSSNTNPIIAGNGVTHYTLNANCVTGSTLTSGISQTTNTAATTQPPICTPQWSVVNGTNVPNGVQQAATVNSIPLCQQACLASLTCIGFDFNTQLSLCWFTGNGTRGSNPAVIHYDLISRCSPTVPPPQGSYQIWYQRSGGVVSVDPVTQQFNLVEDINRAAWLVPSPCLAANNPNFTSNASCLSVSPAGNLTTYLRLSFSNLILDSPTGQVYPRRFNEDSSFYISPNVFYPGAGFVGIQPVVGGGNFYVTGSANSVLTVQPSTISGFSATAFFAVSAPLPTGAPITGTCPNVWTRVSDARLPFLNMVSIGFFTQAVCRQKCLVYPNCVGISYAASSSACWLELRSGLSVALISDPDYIHYDLSPSFYAQCTRGCAYSWALTTANLISGNYVLSTSSASFVNCRIACVANSSCVGVIWSFGATTCSQIIPTTANYIGGSTAVTFYSLARSFTACGPCTATTHILVGVTDSNATPQAGVTDRPSCRTACINNPRCVGFDIIGGNTCALSLTTVSLASSATSNYHVDIIRASCGNGCRDKFDFYPSTTGIATTPFPSATTDQACRIQCQANSTCNSCDWNTNTQTCWFSSQSNVRNLEGTSPGVNHYEWTSLEFCDDDSP